MRSALGTVQNILVLGGGSEIGQAIASKLVEGSDEVSISLAGRRPEQISESWNKLEVSADVSILPYDMTESGTASKCISEASVAGDIDVFVIAAGFLADESKAPSVETVRQLADVNFAGFIEAIAAAEFQITRQGHGTIVVLSSVASQRLRENLAVYGACKAGIDLYCQAISERLERAGGKLVLVRPGFVKTKMTEGLDPAPFSTSADGVATDVAEAISQGDDVVWSPGILKLVFAVLTRVPEKLWKVIASR